MARGAAVCGVSRDRRGGQATSGGQRAVAQGAPGSGFAAGRPEQMLAPALRLCTAAWLVPVPVLPVAAWP